MINTERDWSYYGVYTPYSLDFSSGQHLGVHKNWEDHSRAAVIRTWSLAIVWMFSFQDSLEWSNCNAGGVLSRERYMGPDDWGRDSEVSYFVMNTALISEDSEF